MNAIIIDLSETVFRFIFNAAAVALYVVATQNTVIGSSLQNECAFYLHLNLAAWFGCARGWFYYWLCTSYRSSRIFHSFCMCDKNTRFHSIVQMLTIFKCQFFFYQDATCSSVTGFCSLLVFNRSKFKQSFSLKLNWKHPN